MRRKFSYLKQPRFFLSSSNMAGSVRKMCYFLVILESFWPFGWRFILTATTLAVQSDNISLSAILLSVSKCVVVTQQKLNECSTSCNLVQHLLASKSWTMLNRVPLSSEEHVTSVKRIISLQALLFGHKSVMCIAWFSDSPYCSCPHTFSMRGLKRPGKNLTGVHQRWSGYRLFAWHGHVTLSLIKKTVVTQNRWQKWKERVESSIGVWIYKDLYGKCCW